MPIVDAEKGTLGPFFVLSIWRLEDVENYRDPVFVVAPDNTLVGISCIGYYYSISLNRALCWLVVRDDDFMGGLERHFS